MVRFLSVCYGFVAFVWFGLQVTAANTSGVPEVQMVCVESLKSVNTFTAGKMDTMMLVGFFFVLAFGFELSVKIIRRVVYGKKKPVVKLEKADDKPVVVKVELSEEVAKATFERLLRKYMPAIAAKTAMIIVNDKAKAKAKPEGEAKKPEGEAKKPEGGK